MGYIMLYIGLRRDNGREHGNYYFVFGLRGYIEAKFEGYDLYRVEAQK